MAESATSESVNKDPSNIDWQAALEEIQTTIHGLESDQRSLSQNAKTAWDHIESLGVNKEGAKKFSAMLKKPVDKRRDEFRTFWNLARAAGWLHWLDDLVDRAQNDTAGAPPAAPQPPAAAGAAAPEHPDDDSDLAAGPGDDRPKPEPEVAKAGAKAKIEGARKPVAKGGAPAKGIAAGLEQARGHLEGGTKH